MYGTGKKTRESSDYCRVVQEIKRSAFDDVYHDVDVADVGRKHSKGTCEYDTHQFGDEVGNFVIAFIGEKFQGGDS